MSSRRRAPKRKPVSASVRAGLESLADGNVETIASMLDKELRDVAAAADALEEVMAVNSFSAEMLLANYFSAELLAPYCGTLGKSAKGSAATLAGRIAAEWAKPSFAARKKAKPDDEDEEDDFADAQDWRHPLFYWRGALSIDDTALSWKGTWVASGDGLPSDADFVASANTFEVTAPPVDGLGETRFLPLFAERSFEFTGGSYLLDNGDGPAPYSDVQHKCLVYSRGDGLVVGACGDTEFGRFVSLGRIVESTDGGNRLTLARRYVADSDARAKWTDPLAVVEASFSAPADAPWTAL